VITDEILRELLPTSENFEFAEERRLFYVALTRTKEKVYILGQEKKLSCFFREIKESL
jgi:DNA helicase-4